jgi:hypothetical protein
MKKGFTFQQIALIMLGLIILIGLLLIILTQKDKIAKVVNDLFGAGEQATEGIGDAVDQVLNGLTLIPVMLWPVRKQ